MDHPPFIIVGQGLAGSAIAWQLWQRGLPFLIYDEEKKNTASRIAAGLITPITGQRWTISADFPAHWATASTFYPEIEKINQQTFFHPRPYVRLGKNASDHTHITQLSTRADTAPWLAPSLPSLPESIATPFGAVALTAGGYVDVPAYLQATRRFFAEHVRTAAIDHHALVQRYPGATIIFCEGIAAQHNPYFPWVRWRPAKGQILTLQLPTWTSTSILSRGQWLIPLENHTARLGATYEWHPLDDIPTHSARDQLLTDATTWLGPALTHATVIDHTAAVRPIIRERHALLGRHPTQPNLIFFNGLGSKGTLTSPSLANTLINHLIDAYPLPDEYDILGND
jgi:glycine oxidase